METKPFSQELYAQDDKAKLVFIEWIKGKGWSAIVNPNDYGIDVIAKDLQGNQWGIEVEVKHNWTGKTFPYSSVHFAGRKIKFASEKTIFFMFNNDLTHALAVRGEIVKNCPMVAKKTIYTTWESFIEVKSSQCRFYEILRLN